MPEIFLQPDTGFEREAVLAHTDGRGSVQIEDFAVKTFVCIRDKRLAYDAYEIATFQGRFLALAFSRKGSEFLAGKLDEPATEASARLVLDELKPYLTSCCRYKSPHVVVERLIVHEAVRDEIIEHLLNRLDVIASCAHGLEVVAKIVERASPADAMRCLQEFALLFEGKAFLPRVTAVVSAALDRFGLKDVSYLGRIISENWFRFACVHSGSVALRKVLGSRSHDTEDTWQTLTDAMLSNADRLIEAAKHREATHALKALATHGTRRHVILIYQALSPTGEELLHHPRAGPVLQLVNEKLLEHARGPHV